MAEQSDKTRGDRQKPRTAKGQDKPSTDESKRFLILRIVLVGVVIFLSSILILWLSLTYGFDDLMNISALKSRNTYLPLYTYSSALAIFVFAIVISMEEARKFFRKIQFEESAFWIGFLSALIGVVASLYILYVGYTFPAPGSDANSWTQKLFVGFGTVTFALSVFLLTHLIQNRLSLREFRSGIESDFYEYHKNVREKIDELKKIVDLKDMRYYPDEDTAAREVIHRLQDAKKVHNTHIRFSDEAQRDAHLYPTQADPFHEAAREHCRKGGSWIDVISLNGLERASAILPDEEEYKQSNAQNTKTGAEKESSDKKQSTDRSSNDCYNISDEDKERIWSKYALHVLREDVKVPFVNFIIITRNDNENTREVFFGWGIYDRAAFTNVFSTTNPKVVDYFFEHYLELVRSRDVVRVPKNKLDEFIGFYRRRVYKDRTDIHDRELKDELKNLLNDYKNQREENGQDDGSEQ